MKGRGREQGKRRGRSGGRKENESGRKKGRREIEGERDIYMQVQEILKLPLHVTLYSNSPTHSFPLNWCLALIVPRLLPTNYTNYETYLLQYIHQLPELPGASPGNEVWCSLLVPTVH